jgi:peptidylprolyl isomerase
MARRVSITPDGSIVKEILEEGYGDIPIHGQEVKVHYVGTLESDGTKFDSSRDKQRPFAFTIGKDVIEGWNLAVVTMRQGEKAKVTIAPEYAYGAKGSPPSIPAHATLIFEMELVEIVLPDEEAVAKAEALCAEAANAFKADDFKTANNLYRRALNYVDEKYTAPAELMKIRLHRNISITYGKLGKWQQSVTYADKVLEKERTDPRALLRKCEAHVRLGEVESARKALDSGLAVTKNGPPFLALKQEVEALEREERQRQTEVFKRMLKKG